MRLPDAGIWIVAGSLLVAPALASPGASLTAQASQSAPKVDWQAAAREDVIAAYEMFRRHHPGMADPNNPGFPAQLGRARDAALAFADKVQDAEGHMRALALFSAGLADGHARAQASYSGKGDPLWPGFRTVWRGAGLLISDPAKDGAPRGSMLLSCDGRDASDYIADSVFWLAGRSKEPGSWWTFAPFFFERLRSPYESLPAECRFRHPDGQTISYRLDWRPIPEALFKQWFADATRREPIGLTQPRPGIYRINLPSFSPDEEGRAAYRRLFADIDNRAKEIAAGRAIVIDLRHNGGGSSTWSELVAERLWGKEAVAAAQAAYFRDTRIWYWADSANIAHFTSASERLRAEGRQDDSTYLGDVAAKLTAAKARGDRFYKEDFGARLVKGVKDSPPRRLPPVYVIVDGGCASACLDALDTFTLFPGVKLVGAPTSADSNYLETRFEMLPSGRGGVVLPTKIWVNRPRKSGESYRPHIPVNDLEWTTANMLDHIERDLER